MLKASAKTPLAMGCAAIGAVWAVWAGWASDGTHGDRFFYGAAEVLRSSLPGK